MSIDTFKIGILSMRNIDIDNGPEKNINTRISSKFTYSTSYATKKINSSKKNIITRKMPQRLSITLAPLEVGNTTENLLKEIQQMFIFCNGKKKNQNKYTLIY